MSRHEFAPRIRFLPILRADHRAYSTMTTVCIQSGSSIRPSYPAPDLSYIQTSFSSNCSLSEPRREKQLLTWCGTRTLPEEPDVKNTNTTLAARAMRYFIDGGVVLGSCIQPLAAYERKQGAHSGSLCRGEEGVEARQRVITRSTSACTLPLPFIFDRLGQLGGVAGEV
jgi:hypothetical protein